jgi:hypothetical protein
MTRDCNRRVTMERKRRGRLFYFVILSKAKDDTGGLDDG